MAILELKNIRKSYFLGKDEFPVLKGIDLEFHRGDFVSLLGESGGGKSTLMNIIGGLDREYDGDVIVDGLAQKSKREKDMDTYRRETIGFIFQSFNLVGYLTVLENIMISLKMTELSEGERQNRAIELTKQVGLYEHRNKKPKQLSGGQKQRVAIARALASDPEVILADEPTGALDSQNTKEVLELLGDIAKAGKLVIVVTHSQEVADHGTRIIRLADGRITGDERIKTAYKKVKGHHPVTSKALSIVDTFRTAFKHFTNTWKMNLLITIGTAIGLFAVVFFLGLGTGGTKYMNKQITEMSNPNVISVVRRSASNQSDDNTEAWANANQNFTQKPKEQELTSTDMDKLKNLKNVKSVDKNYYLSMPMSMKYNGKSAVPSQFSTWTKTDLTSSFAYGNPPKENDEVAIGESDLKKLDKKVVENKDWKSMIGKTIEMTFTLMTDSGPKEVKKSLKVSGILKDMMGMANAVTTSAGMVEEMYKENGINANPNMINVEAYNTKDVKQLTKDIAELKTANNKRLYTSNSAGSLLDTIGNITNIVSTVLAAIAGISLVVSTFMIVVTTYMSVAERTKEIGIIRAMGGRKTDISLMFTAESLLLGLSAAAIGIGIALIGQFGINTILKSMAGGNFISITPMHILIALGLSVAISLLASLAPSSRAARLNTIDALASE